MVVFTVAFSPRRGCGLKDAAFGALVAAFPNTGFMGVPLLVALFGARGRRADDRHHPDRHVHHQLAVHRAGADAHARRQPATARARAAAAAVGARRGALSNPMPWAIASARCSARSAGAPAPVDAVIKMLADAASPVALFTIGAVLWRAGQHAHTRTAPTQLRAAGADQAAAAPAAGIRRWRCGARGAAHRSRPAGSP